MGPLPTDIATERLQLVILDAVTLRAMTSDAVTGTGSVADGPGAGSFSWPSWWPDATDGPHVERWLERISSVDDSTASWGARAMVESQAEGEPTMVGHVGFHRPPVDIGSALDDPTYEGPTDPTTGGVVEIGYTVFPTARGRGFATEAAGTLIAMAEQSGEVSTILATVESGNAASIGVLGRIGGFTAIGRCRSDDGGVEIVFRRDGGAHR